MEILTVLLVLLLAARLLGALAERLDQPALVGELLAGVALGVVARGFPDALPALVALPDDEVFVALADLGVFFLMLMAGVELRPKDLLDAPLVPSMVAIVGVVVPLAGGFALGWWWLPDSDLKVAQALFLGTAMAITAVPVAAKVLLDLGQLRSRAGRTIITAAVVDDVLGLVLLAVLTAVISAGESVDGTQLLWLGGRILLFFALAAGVGHVLFGRLGKLLSRPGLAEFEFSALLIVALALSVAAEALGLHFMLGAFMAGLLFVRSGVGERLYDAVRERISAITQGFLAPVFFVSVGLHLDARAVTAVPLFVTLLVAIAFLVKLGAGLPALAGGMPARQAAAVGVGMSARGAVELVVAHIALGAGLFERPAGDPIVSNLYSAVVVMAIVTTLAPSMILPRLLAERD